MRDERIERARERLGTPADVLRAHGFQVRARTARCPFHEDTTPSLSLYAKDGAERWKCHACGIGGDALDLEQRLSQATLIQLLDELAPIDEPIRARKSHAESVSPQDYLRSRGIISNVLIETAGIEYSSDRVWMPWHDANGQRIYSTGRATNGSTPKYVHTKGTKPALFATPIAWQASRVVVVEGHIDALAAAQAHFAAFATTGATISDEAVEILAGKEQVILVADQDEAGQRWRHELLTRLKGRVEICEAQLPPRCKDLADVAAEAVSAGADPEEAVFAVLDHATVTDAGPFRLHAVDYQRLATEGLPQVSYLLEPYVPEGARIWAFGPAESGKSLWALLVAAELTRAGHDVVYISQENPLVEDLRRLSRCSADWTHMRFYHDQGLDLAQRDHAAELVRSARRARLIVLDTLTACWSGDEADNPAITTFDREVLQLLVRETGATILVLDHTGNPQAFVRRRGVHAGRGASSKGQKADVVLEFRSEGQNGFVIEHAKNRMGGHRQPALHLRVIDQEDGDLGLEEVKQTSEDRLHECIQRMVEVITTTGQITTRELRQQMKGFSVNVQRAAQAILRDEDPPRVVVAKEKIVTASGRQTADLWRPAEAILTPLEEEDE